MTYQFRVASPCSADWNQMKGDDRVRYCEDCRLNVYNFSAMTTAEINRLIEEREGRLCGRIYQRPDGTVLTKNCPVGFRAAILRASGFAFATLSTLLSLAPVATSQSTQNQTAAAKSKPASVAFFLEVQDPSGAAITKAKVSIKNEATGVTLTQETNEEGQLNLSDLPTGEYEISIFAFGFATKTLTHVSVPNETLHKAILELGTVTVGVIVIQSHNPVKRFFAKLRHLV